MQQVVNKSTHSLKQLHRITSAAAVVTGDRQRRVLVWKKTHGLLLFAVLIGITTTTSGPRDFRTRTIASEKELEEEEKEEQHVHIFSRFSESFAFEEHLFDSSANVRARRSARSNDQHKGKNERGKSAFDMEKQCEKFSKPKPADDASKRSAKENMEEVEKFCRDEEKKHCVPMPNVVHLSKLCSSLPNNVNHSKLKTLVYTCPSLSCCKQRHFCQSKNWVPVHRTFEINNTTIVNITFQNHTECGCLDKWKCPQPFNKGKSQDECHCSGKSRGDCLRVQNGTTPLSETSRICVEKENCRRPSCSQDRKYDTKTGYCVLQCP